MRHKIDQLTSLRGIAAWWVVLYHFSVYIQPYTSDATLYIIQKGYLAVDFFFILSGFVLFITYGEKVTTFNSKTLIIYVLRRFSRIYPLHILVLLLYISAPISIYLFSTQQQISAKYSFTSFLSNLFLVDAWGFQSKLTWNIPSWSISAEWFAYLLFPFVAYVISKFFGSFLKLLFSMAILWLLFISIYYSLGHKSVGANISEMALIRCIFQFSFGCLLGSMHRMKSALPSTKIFNLFFLGVGYFTLLLFFLTDIFDYMIIGISFGSIILATSLSKGIVSKFLMNPVLKLLGEISYSTYMIHYFVKDWFKFLFVDADGIASPVELMVCFILIFSLSVICFKFIEIPAQRYLNGKVDARIR